MRRSLIAVTILFTAACGVGCATCGGHGAYEFEYELRLPSGHPFNPDADVEVVSAGEASGQGVRNGMHETAPGYDIRHFYSTVLFEGSEQYGVVVQADAATAQVFVLPERCSLKVRDWTDWVGPTYTTDSPHHDAWFGFLHDEKMMHLPFDPASAYQLRYKLKPL